MPPALAALATLQVTWIYNEFFWATVLLQDGSKFPITSALNNLARQFFTDYNLLSPARCSLRFPVLVVFFALQRQFVAGLTSAPVRVDNTNRLTGCSIADVCVDQPRHSGLARRSRRAMSETLANIGLVLLFVLIGGIFAAAEIALVSLREPAHRSPSAGGTSRSLPRIPTASSAVQIGVTAAGFFSAAFGATTLADDVTRRWWAGACRLTLPNRLALVVITLAIVHLSLVLGELAPKRLALQRGGCRDGCRTTAGPVRQLDAAGHLAALSVDRRGRPAARRGSRHWSGGDHRGGVARPALRPRGPQRGRARSSRTCSPPPTVRCAR